PSFMYSGNYQSIFRSAGLVTSVCQKREYGSGRSVVRRLGTILSLEPYPRPYFQVSNLLSYVCFTCLRFLVS
uniref:Mitochondrial fission regulator n=1 Tax=Malurus cyaneus samueli TaxID=2593467 RepID=A0A8C5TNF9_9PASS